MQSTIIVKPTYYCNGSCVYCEAHGSSNSPSDRMDESTIKDLIRFARNLCLRSGEGKVTLIWHGGEPLTMGMPFFNEVRRHIRVVEEEEGLKFSHRFQTNLTLLDAATAEELYRLFGPVRISTSYDPLPGIRKLRRQESYEDKWLQGLGVAKDHGFAVSMVYVAHRKSIGDEKKLLYFFRNLEWIKSVRFNPVFVNRSKKLEPLRDLSISSEMYGSFLINLWDAYEAIGPIGFSLAPFAQWQKFRDTGNRCFSCNSGGTCDPFWAVGPDGGVYTCGRTMDFDLFELGNVKTSPYESVSEHPERYRFLSRRKRLLENECAGCECWEYCGGGCPVEAYLHNGEFYSRSPWCEGIKMFFAERFAKGSDNGELHAP